MKFTSDLFHFADAKGLHPRCQLELELRVNLEVTLQVKTTISIDKSQHLKMKSSYFTMEMFHCGKIYRKLVYWILCWMF